MDLTQKKVDWYRSPVSRDQLQSLNARSDFKGWLQTGGFLGLITLTGAAAIYSAGRWPWPVVLLLFFIHGTCYRYLLYGFHELVHNSVFKTKALNGFFLRLFAFLIGYNHHGFWASHTEHHKYTLHPDDDLEAAFQLTPGKLNRTRYFLRYFIDPVGLCVMFYATVTTAFGKPHGDWNRRLFAAADPKEKRRWVNWARILLVGHGSIIAVSVAMHWWFLPVATTLAPFYGGWLCYLTNNLQHAGLQDNVSDFRLCVRTVTLNPILEFLCWHMNYHTEHHMYAAVPCYNLPKLHEIVKSDLPPCPRGLFQAWTQMAVIVRRQKLDPTYHYVPDLPSPSRYSTTAPSTYSAAD
jgi:fatty acid desaturase